MSFVAAAYETVMVKMFQSEDHHQLQKMKQLLRLKIVTGTATSTGEKLPLATVRWQKIQLKRGRFTLLLLIGEVDYGLLFQP